MLKSLPHAVIIAALVLPIAASAERAETFDEARSLSATEGKPILIEFYRQG